MGHGLKKKQCVLLMLPLIVFALYGCDLDRPPGGEGKLVVMSYNVQNLFDAYVDGTEYSEYTPEGGWSGDGYAQRLNHVGRAIVQGSGVLPDIVVLQEIENDRVLAELLDRELSSRGFRWYAATADPGSAIQTGVISRFPIISATIHGVPGCRSILQVTIDANGSPLVILAFHAKSRLEGVRETEGQRIDLAKVLQSITEEKLAEDSLTEILLAGDFNESADAFLREGGLLQTALIPADSPMAPGFSADGSLLLCGKPPQDGQWYSWWLDRSSVLSANTAGSYWYKGVWETFDQILLSPGCFNGSGWDFVQGQVCAQRMLCDASGHPYAWNLSLKEGYSDHLPVYVVLQRK